MSAFPKDLPKDWKAFHSKKNNKVYYYNTVTKKTQWEHPLAGDRSKKHEGKAKSKKSKIKATNENKTRHRKVNQENEPKQTKSTQKVAPAKIKSEKLSEAEAPQATKPNPTTNLTERKLDGGAEILPPITKPKSISGLSEESASDASERILAWLEDTSRVNFKEHPVPDGNLEKKQTRSKPKSKTTASSSNLNIKRGKKIKEEKKDVILERVKTSVKSTDETNILDKLLPKHVPHKNHAKSRYVPYKASAGVTEQKKKTSEGNEKVLDSNKKKMVTNATAGLNSNQTSRSMPKTSLESVFKVSKTNFPVMSVTTAEANCVQKTVFSQKRDIPAESRLTSSASYVRHSEERSSTLSGHGLQCDGEVLAMEDEEERSISIPPSESEVADMEIDNAEEYEREIVQKLQQMRDNLVVDPNNVSSEELGTNVANAGYEGTLYVVLDTNVLLSHLKFVAELKDFPIQGVGRPTLVVPWVVIQELDSLKDNKWKTHESRSVDSCEGIETRVDMLARIAIKFLNGCFQKSDPRLRGQTIDEAAQQVGNLKEETNDDRILQCCLLFKERAHNGNCILFSNDKNLCNKALVNGIKAFNHQRLIPSLRDLFQCGAIVKQAYFEEYKTQLGIQEELAWRREKADEILCELQIILREGLSYIIETEMRDAYDDIWESIVHIKPPWTLVDVLQLLDKHWIAVFGHIVKRSHKTLVEELQKKFDDRKGTSSSLVFASEVLDLSSKLFRSFAAHSNYNDAIPKCLAAVNVLVQKCKQYQANILSQSTPRVISQPRCLTHNPSIDRKSVGNISAKIRDEQDGIVNENYVPPHEEVMNTFNLIWTAVTQFSTQIFTALGFPNSVPHELAQDLPRASKQEAIQFLGVLGPHLINLVNSIQNILRDPWEKVSQNDSLFVDLEQAIAIFLKEVMSRENYVTAEKLFGFCQDPSMRTSLVQGLSQLDRASAMLQHCATCITQQGGLCST